MTETVTRTLSNEEKKIEYLCQKGWKMININKWRHKNHQPWFSTEAAYLRQQNEDKRST